MRRRELSRAIEALLRDNPRAGLAPAADLGPLRGGLLSAERPRSSEPIEYYMDSGFVALTATDGQIWQSADTSALYASYNTGPFADLGPKAPPPDGSTPPSFRAGTEYDTKKALLVEADPPPYGTGKACPGSYTGKLKWLLAGQYGLSVADPYWSARDDFTYGSILQHPAVGRLSGEGIYTADDGSYWLLELDETCTSGTATLLDTELQSLVDPAAAVTDGGDLQRQLETHALALATKSTTVWPITISGDALVGKPFAYGWHFNRTGREAALVTQEELGPSDYHLIARKYVATVAKGDTSFTFSVSQESQSPEWRVANYLVIWKPLYTGSRNYTPRYNTAGTDLFPQSGILLSCYYDAADVLQPVIFDQSQQIIPDQYGTCGAGVHVNRYLQAADISRPGGNQNTVTITVGTATPHVAATGPFVNGTWDVVYQVSESTQVEVETLTCNSARGVNLDGYDPPCGATRTPKWFVGGNELSCEATKVTTHTNVDIYSERTVYTDHGIATGIAVIFPYDCADGMMVVIEKTEGSIANKYVEVGVGKPWKEQVSIDVRSCGGGVCNWEGFYSSPDLVRTLPIPDTLVSHQLSEHYDITTERYFYHSHGISMAPAHETVAEDLVTGGPWKRFIASVGYPLPTGAPEEPFAIFHGGTDAFMAWDGVDFYRGNGFPEYAERPVGWA